MQTYFNKIFQHGFDAFADELKGRMTNNTKTFVVTANPETLMIGTEILEFDTVLKDERVIIVPDGIGVVKAANILKRPVKERVTGVEIVQKLLELLNEQKKSIYLLGAKKEVVDSFVNNIHEQLILYMDHF